MRRDTFLRRATIWLATIGYAIVVSGLPLPLGNARPAIPESAAAKRLAGKDRSRPFPCMDKPCGCATAEQCFSSCCCNAPAELLAWAKANRVEPTVIATLVRRMATESPARDACWSVTRETCCEADGDQPAVESVPACCAAPSAPDVDATEATADAPRSLSLRAMRACQGIAAEWLLIGMSLPPAERVVVSYAAESVGGVVCFDVSISGSRTAPDAPPPRRA